MHSDHSDQNDYSDQNNHSDHDDHDDFGGLERDSAQLMGRRRALQVLGGGLGLAGLLAACGTSATTSQSAGTTATTAAGGSATPTSLAAGAVAPPGPVTPEETAGPFPADGSNGPNLLTDGAVVRPDITTSIAPDSGTAEGIATTLQLTVVDAASGDPRPGAAVYVWHCTADGRYSIYEIPDQNYLRGVQVADAAGRVTFTTVFPGCYGGRWPHIHFEVYESLEQADAGRNATTVSQLALPQVDAEAVYTDARYGSSARNLSRLTLTRDLAFADGWESQLATMSGSNDAGYTASLLVRV